MDTPRDCYDYLGTAVLKIYSTSAVMHAIIAFEEYCVFKADQLCATAIGQWASHQ